MLPLNSCSLHILKSVWSYFVLFFLFSDVLNPNPLFTICVEILILAFSFSFHLLCDDKQKFLIAMWLNL